MAVQAGLAGEVVGLLVPVDCDCGLFVVHCCGAYPARIQNDNILVVFQGEQPHARLADLGLSRKLDTDGVCSYRDTAHCHLVPEIGAAKAGSHVTTRVIRKFYDVWLFGKRVLPKLLPPELCAAADITWSYVQDGLIAACSDDAPMGRPSMRWLAILFTALSRGHTAKVAADRAQVMYKCPSCSAVYETCDCDGL